MLHLLSCTYLETPLSYFRTEYLQKKQKKRRAEILCPAPLPFFCCVYAITELRSSQEGGDIFCSCLWKMLYNQPKMMLKNWTVCTTENGQSPSDFASLVTSPERGGSHAGKARAKRRPTQWGAGPSLRGLRGFWHLPAAAPTSYIHTIPQKYSFFCKKIYPKKSLCAIISSNSLFPAVYQLKEDHPCPT